MTTTENLAYAIAEGYWTLCTPTEAVEAFRSDIAEGWALEVDGEIVSFDEATLDAAIARFLARAAV